MEVFKLKPAGFAKVKKKLLMGNIPLLLIAMVVGFFVSQKDFSNPVTVQVMLIMIPIVGFALFIGLKRGLKIQKNAWSTYAVEISEDKIIRIQGNVPPITIKKSEIKEIIESKDAYVIKTEQKMRFIAILKVIENEDRVRELLKGFGELTPKKNKNIRYDLIGVIVKVLLMLVFFISQQPIPVISTGIVLCLTLIASFILIQRSKHIDKHVQHMSWAFFLPLFGIGTKLYLFIKMVLIG